jgi:uncharacterized protein
MITVVALCTLVGACASSGSKQPPLSPDAAGPPVGGGQPPPPPAGPGADAPAAAVDQAPGGNPPTSADAKPTTMTTPDGPPSAPADGAAPADSAAPAAGGKLLVYSRTTGNRHVHIPQAVATLRTALTGLGYTVEASEDPAWFTPARLQPLAGVILVSTTGTSLGEPGTDAIAALDGFVRGGGVLVGLHAASSTFYDPAAGYTRLIGGKFVNHPGNVRTASCHAEGTHPAVAKLPEPFVVRDEIYVMSNLRPDNQVILTCDAFGENRRLPIAWYRQGIDGPGRIFYTALGHEVSDWSPQSPYFRDHALPGILWALGR